MTTLPEIEAEVLPKSPEGGGCATRCRTRRRSRAIAMTHDLNIDNNATTAARGSLQSIFSPSSSRTRTRAGKSFRISSGSRRVCTTFAIDFEVGGEREAKLLKE